MIPFAWWDKYRAVIGNFRSKKITSVNKTVVHPEMYNRWDPTGWLYVRSKWPNGVQALDHGLNIRGLNQTYNNHVGRIQMYA